MNYIDALIEDGTHFRVQRSKDGASFGPAGDSDGDLDAFQRVVSDLRRNAGSGYAIQLERQASNRSEPIVDMVVVHIEDGKGGH